MCHVYIRIPKPSVYDKKIWVQVGAKEISFTLYADKVTVIDERKTKNHTLGRIKRP